MVNKSMIFGHAKTSKNVHRPQNTFFWVCKSEKYGNQVPNFQFFEKYMKFAHEISVQNGSYAFPNKLMRFRNKAKPIWGKFKYTATMQS